MMHIPSISNMSSQITNNIFSKIDTKNQGYIEKSDLTSALSKLNGDGAETNTDDVFNSMDTDSDGKLTKSELSKGIESLLSQLQSNALQSSQGDMNGMPPPPEGMKGMPPPPPPMGEDEGVTKDQATEIASSTDDTNLASLMKTVSENFEAADVNQDGKVSAQEAMAYQEKADSSKSSSSTSSANNSVSNIMEQLIKAYGFSNSTNSSSLSISA
ncbi:MAG: EF-hand domain-containing protein [Methylophilus sp.]|nr:EF-hand domain-containing protein [Methylophilus sp.]